MTIILVGWVVSTPEAIHVPSDQEQLSGTDTSLGFLDLQDVNDYLVLDGGKDEAALDALNTIRFHC